MEDLGKFEKHSPKIKNCKMLVESANPKQLSTSKRCEMWKKLFSRITLVLFYWVKLESAWLNKTHYTLCHCWQYQSIFYTLT